MHAVRGAGNRLYLNRAVRKYGEDSFVITPLAQLPTMEKELARRQLDALEIFFIRTLDSRSPDIGYNITAGGGGQLGRKRPHTEAHKKLMSRLMRGRKITWADKLSASQKGRQFSPEHKAKLANSQKGIPKPPRSEEHRRKISENKKKWWAERKINGITGKRRQSEQGS